MSCLESFGTCDGKSLRTALQLRDACVGQQYSRGYRSCCAHQLTVDSTTYTSSSLRPLGRTHEAAGRASVAAAPGWTGDENSNGTSKDCRHFWPQRSQARSLCVWGIDRTNSRSYGGALLARLRSSNGDRYAAALLGAPSVGARRSISTPKG